MQKYKLKIIDQNWDEEFAELNQEYLKVIVQKRTAAVDKPFVIGVFALGREDKQSEVLGPDLEICNIDLTSWNDDLRDNELILEMAIVSVKLFSIQTQSNMLRIFKDLWGSSYEDMMANVKSTLNISGGLNDYAQTKIDQYLFA